MQNQAEQAENQAEDLALIATNKVSRIQILAIQALYQIFQARYEGNRDPDLKGFGRYIIAFYRRDHFKS